MVARILSGKAINLDLLLLYLLWYCLTFLDAKQASRFLPFQTLSINSFSFTALHSADKFSNEQQILGL